MDIPVIDLTSMPPGGRGYVPFIVKCRAHNGDIYEITCYLTNMSLNLTRKIDPEFREIDEEILMRNQLLYFIEPPAHLIDVKLHGEVKSIKGGYTDVFPKRPDS